MATAVVNDSASLTLVGGVVDTVRLRHCGSVQIFNRSLTDPIFVRLDGVDPTVAGDGTKVVLPGTSRQFEIPDPDSPNIRLISSGLSTDYIIERVP